MKRINALDVCVIAAIVACAYYIFSRKESAMNGWQEGFKYDASEPLEETIAIRNGFHPSRDCNTSGDTASVLAVDITYSGLTPIGPTETDNEFGDLLLDKLFEKCTCYMTDDNCFRWTLTIDQMGYSKTDFGRCKGTSCSIKPQPPNDYPMERLNVTLAEIFIITTNVDHPRLTCLPQTVKCALNALNPQNTSNSIVQAIFSAQINKKT